MRKQVCKFGFRRIGYKSSHGIPQRNITSQAYQEKQLPNPFPAHDIIRLILCNTSSNKTIQTRTQDAVFYHLRCCCFRCYYLRLIRSHKRHGHLCALPHRHRSPLVHRYHAYWLNSPFYRRRLAHGWLCSRSCHRRRCCSGQSMPYNLLSQPLLTYRRCYKRYQISVPTDLGHCFAMHFVDIVDYQLMFYYDLRRW